MPPKRASNPLRQGQDIRPPSFLDESDSEDDTEEHSFPSRAQLNKNNNRKKSPLPLSKKPKDKHSSSFSKRKSRTPVRHSKHGRKTLATAPTDDTPISMFVKKKKKKKNGNIKCYACFDTM